MASPHSAEVTTVSRMSVANLAQSDSEKRLVGAIMFVVEVSETRRSAPGVSRAHPLLRAAGASLAAALQPHAAFFPHPPTPAWSILGRYDANLRQTTPTNRARQSVERSCPRWVLGLWASDRGPRCGLRAVARIRTRRALALGGAARSRTAHHNSDSPPRRSVHSTSDQNCGFTAHHASGASSRDLRWCFDMNSARVCVCEWR